MLNLNGGQTPLVILKRLEPPNVASSVFFRRTQAEVALSWMERFTARGGGGGEGGGGIA